jgi:hypothetical protein
VHTGHKEGSKEPIDNIIQEILDHHTTFEERFPEKIRCFAFLQDVYSLDNRRLFIARVLEGKGMVKTIAVELFQFHHKVVQGARTPHWLRKADTTDRGNSIFVKSKSVFRDPGCQDLGFTPPPCEKYWWKSRLELAKAEVRTQELAEVKLKKRILRRIAKGIDDTQYQRYVEFVNRLFIDFADSKSAYPNKTRLDADIADAKKKAREAKDKMELVEYFAYAVLPDRVVIKIPHNLVQIPNGLDGVLGHAKEEKIRLGFRGRDNGVEIYAWPDENCSSLNVFERGCERLAQDLRSCYCC